VHPSYLEISPPNVTTLTSTDRLAELLCQKLKMVEEILSLSNAQLALVRRDEVDSLMELLAIKQVSLDQMRDLQTQLAPYRGENPDERVWHSARRREQVQIVAARCESILEEVMQIEKECERILKSRRDAVAADLKAADSAQLARDAYAACVRDPGGDSHLISDA
jgi:hypothetical protein